MTIITCESTNVLLAVDPFIGSATWQAMSHGCTELLLRSLVPTEFLFYMYNARGVCRRRNATTQMRCVGGYYTISGLCLSSCYGLVNGSAVQGARAVAAGMGARARCRPERVRLGKMLY